MSSIIKFKASASTFVDSGHANQNFCENKNILAGSYHKTSCSSIMFKSLISFDLHDLQDSPLSYAYLCLYVKDCNSDSSYYSNNILSLYRNTNNFDANCITWNTLPPSDCPVHFSVNNNEIGRYVKINITSIVNSWINNDHNFGITIEANNYYSSLIKFASVNSSNPPLLVVQYKHCSL